MKKNDGEHKIAEAVLSGFETVADIVMEGELLASIPFVGSAFQICKGIDSYRDRTYMARLLAFAVPLKTLTSLERKKMGEQLASSKEATKAGEVLLLTLEQVNDLKKAELLGEVFVKYAKGHLTSELLLRITHVIHMVFYGDLADFLEAQTQELDIWDDLMRVLAEVGLTQSVGGKTYDDDGSITYEVSPLGRQLRTLFQDKQRGMPRPQSQLYREGLQDPPSGVILDDYFEKDAEIQ